MMYSLSESEATTIYAALMTRKRYLEQAIKHGKDMRAELARVINLLKDWNL